MANKKVGTKTGKKTTAGKDVYKTPEGESVSEKSVTIKFGENAYVNAPSIHDGVEYSEDEIKQMLMDGKIKPTSRHDTLEEALEAAQERSNTLMNEGGMAIEKQTKPLFSKLFRPEVNLSGETTSKNIDFGELNNEPLKAELKQKNLFGRLGFTGTTENNTSYGLGANLTSNKGTITTPKELREYGVPEKIKFGSGKLKGNSYDGFLALQDIFGVEGLEARIDAGYTPLEYEKDLKKLALNFKYKFNEGGMSIEKQMEMFEDGGLMQEGGTIDPVSGNDVPVGSTQEEVRDDIPAQLSEGEFVFPADVVRFYGLEKLMEMRQRAKAGLRMMEDMGQMGNSEEATLPDDIPFDLEDLDMEDGPEYNNTMEMQVGGFVQPQGFTGIQTMRPSVFQNYQPQYVPYQAPTVPTTYQPVQQQAVPTFTGQVPQAQDFLKTPQPGEQDLRKYVNAEGQVRMIPFVNDQPIYPIPQGFYPEAEKPVEEPAPTAVTTETTRVTDRGGRDDNVTVGGRTTTEIQQGISEVKDRFAITGSRGLDILSLLPGGNIIKNMFDVQGPTIGKKAPGDIIGPKDQLRMEYEKVLGTGITGYVGYEKGDLDPVTGGVFDSRGRAVNEDGSAALNNFGTRSYSNAKDWANDIKAGQESGWRGGPISSAEYYKLNSVAKDRYNKYAEITGAKSYSPPGFGDVSKSGTSTTPGDKDGGMTGRDTGSGTDFASNLAGLDFSRDRSRDTGANSGSSSSGKGDSSGIGGCFAKGTMFKMADGTTKAIEDIKYGDKMYKGGLVYAIMQGDGTLEDWYNYNNVHVTSGHPVYDKGVWKRVGNTDNKVSIDNYDVYYSLMNTNHLMVAENGTIFTDFVEIGADVGDRGNWMMQMLNEREAEATAA